MGDYIADQLIGQGSFARVYRAYHKATHQAVAIKSINRDLLSSEKLMANLEQEIKILKSLKHPNIVRFYEVMVTVCR